MKNDLTLNKINNTSFSDIYNKFIIGEQLKENEYLCLLSNAICFINADENCVRELGYRIVLEYCNQKKDYTPLYSIAINNGIYPICRYIENNCIDDIQRSFFSEWNDSFIEQYVSNGVCKSEQQKALVSFFINNMHNTVSVVAPTSYGKSELILDVCKEYKGKNVCIITPTKALLLQTKKRIQDEIGESFSRIIVHPEMYNKNDKSFIAVFTQERLFRLLKEQPELSFDCVVIDEAHEILEDNFRSQILANTIIVMNKRNKKIAYKFLTPFIADSTSLKTRYSNYEISEFSVSEYIKSEKFYIYDLRCNKGLKLYDQFLNKFISICDKDKCNFEEEVVKKYSKEKNIIYLNKPSDIEKFSLELAASLPELDSDKIRVACDNLSNYLKPEYNLIYCLRKGIIYHHGSVPDAIRYYIEDLYKTCDEIKYVVTSSTLLSGVNLPAETIFILDNKKGPSNLRRESFKNLVGRVCRFNDIFNNSRGDLSRLEPEIYLVVGRYYAKNSNVENFLKKVAKREAPFKDEVNNVLLTSSEITADENKKKLLDATEYIENYERGIVKDYNNRYVKTEIGNACILNGILEIDLFDNENAMQNKLKRFKNEKGLIDNAEDLLNIIYELFISYVNPDKKNDEILRLKNKEARNFYKTMINWRTENTSYSKMIGLYIGYWKRLYLEDNDAIIYVGHWGDIKLNSPVPRYTRLAGKNFTKIINLAIVRIKEEQDFIDNKLMKFVETLYDIGILKKSFYEKIKYGTDNNEVVFLLKNGLSLSLSTLLVNKYKRYINLDSKGNVVIDNNIINEMKDNNENAIQIHEIRDYI